MVSNDELTSYVRLPKDTYKAMERVCKEADLTKQDFLLNCVEGTLSDLDSLAAMGLPVRRLKKIQKVLVKMGFMEPRDLGVKISGNLAGDLAK